MEGWSGGSISFPDVRQGFGQDAGSHGVDIHILGGFEHALAFGDVDGGAVRDMGCRVGGHSEAVWAGEFLGNVSHSATHIAGLKIYGRMLGVGGDVRLTCLSAERESFFRIF